MTMPDVITDKAKYQRGWTGGGAETPCGYGSRMDQTAIQRKWIPEMVAKYNIGSIADIGCGDLNWAARTAFVCTYTPYDLILRAQGVKQLNILTDELPDADCLMVLWVLNHFPEAEARLAMDKLVDSGARYLMMTWESRQWEFTNLEAVDSVVIRKRNDERGNVEIRLIKL